jgi:hypothetical protein
MGTAFRIDQVPHGRQFNKHESYGSPQSVKVELNQVVANAWARLRCPGLLHSGIVGQRPVKRGVEEAMAVFGHPMIRAKIVVVLGEERDAQVW